MYRMIVRRVARNALRRLNEGDYESIVRMFAPDGVFAFAGDHALAGTLVGQDVRRWFERAHRLLPGHRLQPLTIAVSGPPWNTVVATHFVNHAPLKDRAYVNEGMQLLRLRWGRVVEDRIFEDSQALAKALAELAAAGHEEAGAPPLGPNPLDNAMERGRLRS